MPNGNLTHLPRHGNAVLAIKNNAISAGWRYLFDFSHVVAWDVENCTTRYVLLHCCITFRENWLHGGDRGHRSRPVVHAEENAALGGTHDVHGLHCFSRKLWRTICRSRRKENRKITNDFYFKKEITKALQKPVDIEAHGFQSYFTQREPSCILNIVIFIESLRTKSYTIDSTTSCPTKNIKVHPTSFFREKRIEEPCTNRKALIREILLSYLLKGFVKYHNVAELFHGIMFNRCGWICEKPFSFV